MSDQEEAAARAALEAAAERVRYVGQFGWTVKHKMHEVIRAIDPAQFRTDRRDT